MAPPLNFPSNAHLAAEAKEPEPAPLPPADEGKQMLLPNEGPANGEPAADEDDDDQWAEWVRANPEAHQALIQQEAEWLEAWRVRGYANRRMVAFEFRQGVGIGAGMDDFIRQHVFPEAAAQPPANLDRVE